MFTHGFICYPLRQRVAPGTPGAWHVDADPQHGVVGGDYAADEQVVSALISGGWFLARAPWNPSRWMCGRLGDMSPFGYPYPLGGGCGATDWSTARAEFMAATGADVPEQKP